MTVESTIYVKMAQEKACFLLARHSPIYKGLVPSDVKLFYLGDNYFESGQK